MRSLRPQSPALVVPALVVAALAATGFVCGFEPAATAAGTDVVAGGLFTAVASTRVLDTREGPATGSGTSGLPPVGDLVVPLTDLPDGVTAVALCITVPDSQRAGWLAVDAERVTTASNVQVPAGATSSTFVISRVSSGRTVTVHNGSPVWRSLVVDVQGYWSASADGAVLAPAPSERLIDTRSGVNVVKRPLAPNGRLNIPDAAGPLTVTVVAPKDSGYLSVGPVASPVTSAVTLVKGVSQTTPVVAEPGPDGTVHLLNVSRGSVDVTVDRHGRFASSGPGARFVAAPMRRVLDTRHRIGTTSAALAPGADLWVPVSGLPPATTSVAVAVTALGSARNGWVSVGSAAPTSPHLDVPRGGTVATTLFAPVVDGRVLVHNGGTAPVHVLVDLQGYAVTAPLELVVPQRRVLIEEDVDVVPQARGGSAPYDWTITGAPAWARVTSGRLPVLRGLPDALGTTEVGVTVRDGAGTVRSGTLPLTVIDGTLPTGGHEQTLSLATDAALLRLSCPEPGFCMAVDTAAETFVLRDGTWTGPLPSPWSGAGAASPELSCSGPDWCMITNLAGPGATTAATWDGRVWTALPGVTSDRVTGVSCPEDGFCRTIDSGDASFTVVGGVLQPGPYRITVPMTPGSPPAISCVSASWCVATMHGRVSVRSIGLWSRPQPYAAGPSNGGALDCPRRGVCLATGQASSGGQGWYLLDHGYWRPALPTPGGPVPALDCADEDFCVGVTLEGAYVRDHGLSYTSPTGAGTVVACLTSESCVVAVGALVRW